MGLLDIINKNKGEDTTNNLTKEELEFLLVSLKKTTFTGEYLEMLFNIVIKLQNQYQKYN
jgi:hypothetical protein